MSFLDKLDDALLEGFFQKITDKSRAIGLSNSLLAQLCASSIIFVAVGMYAVIKYVYKDPRALSNLLPSLIGIYYLWASYRTGKILEQLPRGVKNPISYLYSTKIARLMCLWLASIATMAYIIACFALTFEPSGKLALFQVVPTFWGMSAVYYFIACTPNSRGPLRPGNDLARDRQ